jgi:thiamine biosynthesis lipoprotein
MGVTQALSPRAIVQSNFTYSRGHGYYSDPYKPLDTRPDRREIFAWLLRYNRALPETDATLQLSYRYLHDSFGGTSNAVEAAWWQPLPAGWSVTPSLRYYTQGAADFYYNPPYPQGYVAGQDYSADTRLSAFGAFTTAITSPKRLPAALPSMSGLHSIGSAPPGTSEAKAAPASRRSRPIGSRSASPNRSRVLCLPPSDAGQPSVHTFRTVFRAMALEHELTLCSDDPSRARRAAELAIADVARIEAKYSRYRDDSLTTRINRAADRRGRDRRRNRCPVRPCGPLLPGERRAVRPDIGRLAPGMDFRRTPPHLPDAAALDAATALNGRGRVEWSDSAVRLPRAGMEIDFGGIAKEYAADRVATISIEQGVEHGLVNLGGDVRAIGPRPDGSPCRVGIRQPRRAGIAIAAAPLAAGALARVAITGAVRNRRLVTAHP